MKGDGELRQSQVVTTFGPGSLIELPNRSAIVAGLEDWPPTSELTEIVEPRMTAKLAAMTGIASPGLFAPPEEEDDPSKTSRFLPAIRFPTWYVVQDKDDSEGKRSRRLVPRRLLDDKSKFDGLNVVPTRFLRACPKGHIDDLNWHLFVHGPGSNCPRTSQLWLDETGTGGELKDLTVRCQCKAERPLVQATQIELHRLGTCQGKRPWLGLDASEECNEPSRLLIRTASNAYFSQALTVLSLPIKGSKLDDAVASLWGELQYVEALDELRFTLKKPVVSSLIGGFNKEDIIAAIGKRKRGAIETSPLKLVELDVILDQPEGFGDDIPIDENFHARRLPEEVWRKRGGPSDKIDAVVQLHRLREVVAQVGFTRFEAYAPDFNGEYDTDVKRASISREANWFPAIENRGEGLFLSLRSDAVKEWMSKDGVKDRVESLAAGQRQWANERKLNVQFPGGPYVMLHTLSHLLIQVLSIKCGYPATSIRERVFSDPGNNRYGLLLYTASADAEGTLGGLVQQARYISDHLASALSLAMLCSNDPVCSHHSPQDPREQRWLHGASCHGCTLIGETSCEARNDYLDRALVVPVLGSTDSAFFEVEK